MKYTIFCAYYNNVHNFFDFLCISSKYAQLFQSPKKMKKSTKNH